MFFASVFCYFLSDWINNFNFFRLHFFKMNVVCATVYKSSVADSRFARYTKGDGKSWIWSVTSTVSDRKFKTATKAFGEKIIVRKSIFKSQQKSSLLFSLFSVFFVASRKHTKNKQISQKFKRLSFFLFAFKILVYRNRGRREKVWCKDKLSG